MIKDPQALKEFENNFRREKLSYDKSLKIFESMWKKGVRLGALPPKDDLEGIEVDIRVAAVLNSCLKKSWLESVILKNPGIDAQYIKNWLKEFDASFGEKDFLKTFEGILNEL